MSTTSAPLQCPLLTITDGRAVYVDGTRTAGEENSFISLQREYKQVREL